MRYVGRGKIQGHLYDLGRFPGAVPSSSPQNKITGEVYELSNPDKLAGGSKHGCIFFLVGPQRPARSTRGITQKLIHVAAEHTP